MPDHPAPCPVAAIPGRFPAHGVARIDGDTGPRGHDAGPLPQRIGGKRH